MDDARSEITRQDVPGALPEVSGNNDIRLYLCAHSACSVRSSPDAVFTPPAYNETVSAGRIYRAIRKPPSSYPPNLAPREITEPSAPPPSLTPVLRRASNITRPRVSILRADRLNAAQTRASKRESSDGRIIQTAVNFAFRKLCRSMVNCGYISKLNEKLEN